MGQLEAVFFQKFNFKFTQRLGVAAMLLRSLKQVFWKKSAFYVDCLRNKSPYFLNFLKKITDSVCVYVCVYQCVCVCVCVCVFIFLHREGFFRLQDVQDILERYGSTILCCEYLFGCFCQVALSPYLKMSYFTSKDENSSHHNLERKRYDILIASEKMIYLDIGYKSAPN